MGGASGRRSHRRNAKMIPEYVDYIRHPSTQYDFELTGLIDG
jgi:hypothetical protein